MAWVKHTMLIQQTTEQTTGTTLIRIGGWSESWYGQGFFPGAFQRLCARRASLLTRTALIIGQRYQQVDPVGTSSTGGTVTPGNVVSIADIPQMSLFCRARSTGLRNIRPMYIRGIPDVIVLGGEYVVDASYTAKLNQFFSQLSRDTWSFRGRDLDTPSAPVFQVGSTGVFSLTQVFTFAVGDLLQFSRCKDVAGKTVTFRGLVTAKVDSQNGTIAGYPAGGLTGGKVRKISYVYPPVTSVDINRIVTRRVGRPFAQFRGRRSNRR